MLRVLKEEKMTVVRADNEAKYAGHVVEVNGSDIVIEFHGGFEFALGEKVSMKIERDYSFTTVYAELTEVDGNRCHFAALVDKVEMGVDRATRAVAPGTTISITCNEETVIGSICDVSESGLRVRSLGDYEMGQDIQLNVETEMGSIGFTGRVARVVYGVDSESSDIGIQIIGMERLERARYNHFVDSLVRKARMAS